jgi:aspartate kinase
VMIPSDAADAARACLARDLAQDAFTVDDDVATVSVVGHGLTGVPGISRRILGSLVSLGIDPDAVSSSGLSMTIVLPKARVTEVVRRLHVDLGLGEPTRDAAEHAAS